MWWEGLQRSLLTTLKSFLLPSVFSEANKQIFLHCCVICVHLLGTPQAAPWPWKYLMKYWQPQPYSTLQPLCTNGKARNIVCVLRSVVPFLTFHCLVSLKEADVSVMIWLVFRATIQSLRSFLWPWSWECSLYWWSCVPLVCRRQRLTFKSDIL